MERLLLISLFCFVTINGFAQTALGEPQSRTQAELRQSLLRSREPQSPPTPNLFIPSESAAEEAPPLPQLDIMPETETAPEGPEPIGPNIVEDRTIELLDVATVVKGMPNGYKIPATEGRFEDRVLELTNIERTKRGLLPLGQSEELAFAARYHAADMALEDYFDHDSHDRDGRRLVFITGTFSRIAQWSSNAGAENIAAGYSTPEALVEGWMNSPGHRANILNENLKTLGVGVYRGPGSYSIYSVQNFGY